MNKRILAVVCVLSVMALMGTGVAYAATADGDMGTDTELAPLLTEEQMEEMRQLEESLMEQDMTCEQVHEQMMDATVEYLTQNLMDAGMSDEEVEQVLGTLDEMAMARNGPMGPRMTQDGPCEDMQDMTQERDQSMMHEGPCGGMHDMPPMEEGMEPPCGETAELLAQYGFALPGPAPMGECA